MICFRLFHCRAVLDRLRVLSASSAFILIAIVYWTYTDAKKNSSQPAILWAIVVFIAPLLGLLIYFLLGRGKA